MISFTDPRAAWPPGMSAQHHIQQLQEHGWDMLQKCDKFKRPVKPWITSPTWQLMVEINMRRLLASYRDTDSCENFAGLHSETKKIVATWEHLLFHEGPPALKTAIQSKCKTVKCQLRADKRAWFENLARTSIA
eukprot:1898339-Amphidinium_carterae.1